MRALVPNARHFPRHINLNTTHLEGFMTLNIIKRGFLFLCECVSVYVGKEGVVVVVMVVVVGGVVVVVVEVVVVVAVVAV